MEEFDVLLTDISRVNKEITRIKATCEGLMPKVDKKLIFSLNIDNQSGKNPEITPEYC